MTRQKGILLLAGSVIALFALWGLKVHDRFVRGPSYDERPLSAWLRDLDAPGSEPRSEAREAVRQIGTNGLPLIARWLDWNDSGPVGWLTKYASKGDFAGNFHTLQPAERRALALTAYSVLGPAAQPVIPTLERIATEKNPELDAAFLIARIGGPQAAPSLTRILASTNKFIHAGARISLEMLRTNSTLLRAEPPPLPEYHRLVGEAVAKGHR